MAFCIKCGAPLVDEALFCSSCGQRQREDPDALYEICLIERIKKPKRVVTLMPGIFGDIKREVDASLFFQAIYSEPLNKKGLVIYKTSEFTINEDVRSPYNRQIEENIREYKTNQALETIFHYLEDNGWEKAGKYTEEGHTYFFRRRIR